MSSLASSEPATGIKKTLSGTPSESLKKSSTLETGVHGTETDIDLSGYGDSDGDNQDDDENLTLWQAIRRWRRVTLYCVGMTSAILMYGYDFVIIGSGSAMPSFQRDFGEQLDGKWILPSLWFGLWNFASPGASMVGAVLGGLLQDWAGRRRALIVGSVLSAVGVAILFVSYLPEGINARRGVFLGGKAFQGMALGVVMVTTQTYMSEVLPPKLRGSIIAFFPTFTLLGQLIGAAVIYACLDLEKGYRICFATQWPFSVMPFVVALIIPESPTYLVRKGRLDDALRAQVRLDTPGTGADSRRAIDIIARDIEHEISGTKARATYADCFRGTNFRRTLIIFFANLMPQIFGLTLLSKASYFMQVVGMDASLSLLVLVGGIACGFAANLVSVWLLSLYGRRLLTLLSLTALVVLWTSMGIAGIWTGNSDAVIWFTTAALILIIITAGLGIWPCSFAISSETSSLHLRAKAQGIGWFTASAGSAIFGFTLPYAFNLDQGNLAGKTGFIHSGLCVIAWVVTFLYVPEMKGRTPAEIDRMFELRLPAREFETWRLEDERR